MALIEKEAKQIKSILEKIADKIGDGVKAAGVEKKVKAGTEKAAEAFAFVNADCLNIASENGDYKNYPP